MRLHKSSTKYQLTFVFFNFWTQILSSSITEQTKQIKASQYPHEPSWSTNPIFSALPVLIANHIHGTALDFTYIKVR